MDIALFEKLKPQLAEHIMKWLDDNCPISRDETLEVRLQVKSRSVIQIQLEQDTRFQSNSELLATLLEDLPWAGRGQRKLCEKLITVGQLCRLNEDQIRSNFSGMGYTTLENIKTSLKAQNLGLELDARISAKEVDLIRSYPTKRQIMWPLSTLRLEEKFPTLGELVDAPDEICIEYIKEVSAHFDENDRRRLSKTPEEILDMIVQEMNFVLDTLDKAKAESVATS